MENDSNPQPQKTGGLKMMTVFIGVLALHVVVILGITVYHLFNSGSNDPELIAADKTHKDVKVTPDDATVSDGTLPDGTASKTASTDSSETPITIPQPPANGGDTAASASAGTPAATPGTEAAPGDTTATASTPSGPSAVSIPQPGANQPSGPIAQAGPVITPPATDSTANGETAIDSPTAGVAPATDDAGGTTTYTVKSGDSLARIAHQHHIKIAALRAANHGVKSNLLQIGEKLTIPAPALAPTPTAVASTDSATTTAAEPATAAPADADNTQLDGSVATTAKPKHHVHSEPNRTLLGDSPEITSSEVAGSSHDKAVLTGGGRHVYTVARGDTLNKIARKFHTSPNAIMALNDISDARKLRLGQKLRIPAREARSATSAPATPQQQHPDEIEPRATPSAQLANFIN